VQQVYENELILYLKKSGCNSI